MRKTTSGFRGLALLLCTLGAVSLTSACGDSDGIASVPPIPEQPGTAQTPTESVQISIPVGATGRGSSAFGANPREVPFGATVVWTNDDSVPHSVTSNDSTFDSGQIKPGAKFSYTFTRSGTYRYYCSIHGMGSMNGAIEVQ